MRKTEHEIDKWFFMPKELLKRHRKQLGIIGIAVYALLSAYADKYYRAWLNYRQIHKKLSITNAEIVRALHLLEDLHLIRQELGDKRIFYRILWIPPWGLHGENPVDTKPKFPSPSRRYSIKNTIDYYIADIGPLKRKITLTNFMNENYNENIDDKDTEYNQSKMQLAHEIAEALGDKDAIYMHIAYVYRFPESLLREALTKALAVPDSKVKTSRARLYNFLVQQYATAKKHYPRS